MKHVVVIGAGISGLAAAYRLHQAGIGVTLLEAGDHAGGVIRTLHEQGCLLETGPDCWASNKPAGIELVRELGLESELIGTREGVRRSFILHGGRLKRLPEGFFLISPMSLRALIHTPILSAAGKLRMACELLIPPRRGDGDESLAGFVRRRFGVEALERIAQPMIAGIYTADPEKLSLKATFPQFMQWEREQGSVIRALRKRSAGNRESVIGNREAGATESRSPIPDSRTSGPRYGLFVTLKQGMSALTDALVKALPPGTIRFNTRALAVNARADGVSVTLADDTLAASAAVLALPAHASARLLAAGDGALAKALGEIEYAGAAVVNFIFERSQIRHAMDGIGAVIPAIESRRIIAFSFSSVKFEGRAPEGMAVVRVFMGGAMNPEVAALPEDELKRVALEELRGLIGVEGEPKLAVAGSHLGAMAQYHVGHIERVARIRELAANQPRLAICGNAFDGVGIPDCIRGANEAVAALLQRMESQ